MVKKGLEKAGVLEDIDREEIMGATARAVVVVVALQAQDLLDHHQ